MGVAQHLLVSVQDVPQVTTSRRVPATGPIAAPLDVDGSERRRPRQPLLGEEVHCLATDEVAVLDEIDAGLDREPDSLVAARVCRDLLAEIVCESDRDVQLVACKLRRGRDSPFSKIDDPGRHELDETQEINYPAVMKAIAETGFTGYIGHEFMPTRDPLDGLRQAVALCNV